MFTMFKNKKKNVKLISSQFLGPLASLRGLVV